MKTATQKSAIKPSQKRGSSYSSAVGLRLKKRAQNENSKRGCKKLVIGGEFEVDESAAETEAATKSSACLRLLVVSKERTLNFRSTRAPSRESVLSGCLD